MGNKKTNKPPVLLIDDEIQILISYSVMLKSAGIDNVFTIEDSRQVMPFLKENGASAIVLDLTMPFVSGQELLTEIKNEFPEIPVIIATATNDITTAIECMQNGADNYLVKPIEKNQFISSVKRVLELQTLKSQVSNLKNSLLSENLKNPESFSGIVTINRKMESIFKYIEAIAYSPFPVLITGETGTGKEMIARSIHLSNSNSKSFIVVNVAGLDDNLFSDTLFGHKKGAFTGAENSREGLILQAENGTLFLDEIGDLSMQSQVKLLRLIQEKEYYQLGSDTPLKTTARVVVTANTDLKRFVKEGKFRKDLFFRLSAHQINIPPLRERKEDIRPLTDFFIEEAALSMNKKIPSYPPELITLLSTYPFNGNIRELQAFIYDAVSRHESGILSLQTFKDVIETGREMNEPEGRDNKDEPVSDFFSQFPTLKEAENFLIEKAMAQAKLIWLTRLVSIENGYNTKAHIKSTLKVKPETPKCQFLLSLKYSQGKGGSMIRLSPDQSFVQRLPGNPQN